jgi:hypothetical protein
MRCGAGWAEEAQLDAVLTRGDDVPLGVAGFRHNPLVRSQLAVSGQCSLGARSANAALPVPVAQVRVLRCILARGGASWHSRRA